MKKGISLIVLVITIIVIIILAGAVILSLANNNPIAQANQATRDSDADSVQSAISMYMGRVMAEYRAPVKIGVAGWTNLSGDTVALTSDTGVNLWRNPAATNAADIVKASATSPGAGYTQLFIKAADLGFATWPTSGSMALQVDQNGDVRWQ